MTTIDEVISAQLRRENDLIEGDLRTIVGPHELWLISERVREMGHEVVHQRTADGSQVYRGIRQKGRWIIDRHPELGEVYEYASDQ